MISTHLTLREIPIPIRLFLGKALLFFIVWKLVFLGFLSESKVLDYPLTTNVGKASTELLNSIGSMSGYKSVREVVTKVEGNESFTEEISQIYHNDKKILYVEDGCNGLELLVLYIGFIVCMPSNIWRKIFFIIGGVVILHAANIIRSMALIYVREYHELYFDFAHTYLFKLVLYAVTFVLWIIYAKKIHLLNEIPKA
ncbi:archaeosortase/exosortase family protein [Winogradskyella sp. DF17]|uniref:Archaeosortase/exosortase family protein n=1 Tax=Winogradskyella pelagia TaxID=2819984 RepID=A0ABS3T4Y9_9FLAO|nr:archaeosortase/exosortase family protein [Winogradskyella sp. DF17]